MQTPNRLTAYVDTWTVQAVMTSGWLTRLYRSLRDDRQASLASQAGAPAAERMQRRNLRGRVAPLELRFNQDHPEETLAEEAAWMTLVEAQAGLAAFFAITAPTEEKPTPGLRGARTAAYKAFQKTIRGFRTAFPDEIVSDGVASAVRKAATTCADALLANLEEEDPKKLDHLRAGLEACVFEALEGVMVGEM